MKELDDLHNAAGNLESLQHYLDNNFEKVYDFFTLQKHYDLVALREKINRFIQLNRNIVLKLDIRNKTNLSFISLLLDISEELGLIGSFHFLYNHLQNKDFNIGERLKAASLYLIGVRTADDYISRYDQIFNHLQEASVTEEDNTDRVLMTMVNYYAQVIHDFGEFNSEVVLKLKAKLQKSIGDFENSFLNCKFLEDVLNIQLDNFHDAYLQIHSLLDSFLGRDIVLPAFINEFLIESGTEYCDLLENVVSEFSTIRQISVRKYQLIGSDSIFYSLGRGTAVLTNEAQLYAYMNSHGKMHYEKLVDAFKTLPKELFKQEANIVDWGCGQAIASMTYLNFLNQINSKHKISNITLIEPSELALKRAALHVRKFNTKSKLFTVNKDLDSLLREDIARSETKTNIHIFSNILDIENFSLSHLLKLVESTFNGVNYFVCVSPYINDIRTSRLDAFTKYFSKKDGYEMIDTVDNRAGQWQEGWTRVVRVLKVNL